MGFRALGRSPLTLGVFVEGTSDLQTIPKLIRRLGYRGGIRGHSVRGDMLSVREMSNQIMALLSRRGRVSRVLIFIDSEGADPNQTLRGTERALPQLRRVAGRVPVDYVVVDHSIEGWLACDTDALRAVLGQDARINIQGNPEDQPRPARSLERVFRDNGVEFKKTVHNEMIAKRVTARNILQKSPTFVRLASILGAPVA